MHACLIQTIFLCMHARLTVNNFYAWMHNFYTNFLRMHACMHACLIYGNIYACMHAWLTYIKYFFMNARMTDLFENVFLCINACLFCKYFLRMHACLFIYEIRKCGSVLEKRRYFSSVLWSPPLRCNISILKYASYSYLFIIYYLLVFSSIKFHC
jgi:hypothetical protein